MNFGPVLETAVQARRGVIAYGGGALLNIYSAPITMSTIEGATKLLLFAYALGQLGYLAWRWYTAWKDRRNGKVNTE